jgi:hypothetical protein
VELDKSGFERTMNEQEAIAIAVKHNHGVELIDPHVHTELPSNCGGGCAVPFNNCWFILSLPSDEPLMIRSSRLIVISKETGKVLFDGDACDEG